MEDCNCNHGSTNVGWYCVGSALPACQMTGEVSQNAGYISQQLFSKPGRN